MRGDDEAARTRGGAARRRASERVYRARDRAGEHSGHWKASGSACKHAQNRQWTVLPRSGLAISTSNSLVSVRSRRPQMANPHNLITLYSSPAHRLQHAQSALLCDASASARARGRRAGAAARRSVRVGTHAQLDRSERSPRSSQIRTQTDQETTSATRCRLDRLSQGQFPPPASAKPFPPHHSFPRTQALQEYLAHLVAILACVDADDLVLATDPGP